MLRGIQTQLHAVGITSYLEANTDAQTVAAYVELARLGELRARVTIALESSGENTPAEFSRLKALRAMNAQFAHDEPYETLSDFPFFYATKLPPSVVNIGPDGSVDWDADFLAGFDICVASVHSHFEQSRAEMTRRFVAACENPHVNVIGHPTTRRMGKRPPVEVDFGELFRACARTGTALEINASPQRLDLPSDHIRAARDAGVRFAIDSDAHSVSDLGNMPYGVGTAQRGWLTPDDVINTWPLDRLRAFLRKDR